MASASSKKTFVTSKITSQRYHDIFDFKLTKEEQIRWQYKNQKVNKSKARPTSLAKNKSRLQREKYSESKLKIAKRASEVLSKIPTVKFVGITGSLAMMNAGKNSDIDLMIITKGDSLWLTRLLCYLVIWFNGFKIRHPKNKTEKDMLCINLWLDEKDLKWDRKDRNMYTAHEIAQIISLTNKDETYEKFLWQNKWILDYWPNSVQIKKIKSANNILSYTLHALNLLAFKIQHFYMKNKITREVVTKTRAIFHPNDWGRAILERINSVSNV